MVEFPNCRIDCDQDGPLDSCAGCPAAWYKSPLEMAIRRAVYAKTEEESEMWIDKACEIMEI